MFLLYFIAFLPTFCYTQIGDIMLKLSLSNLHKAFFDFHTLTNMKIALYDKKGNAVLSYPKEAPTFCQMIESHPKWGKKCIDCDMKYFEASAKAKEEIRYKCHLGLSEAVVPIRDGDEILGFVMLGQILTEDLADDTRNQLKNKLGGEFENVAAAIDNIPVKSNAEIEASITILKSLATYFLSNKWVAPLKNEFITALDRYQDENISFPITANDICSAFHICRTSLYDLAKQYLDCPIAEYVQNYRIAKACSMLKDTQKPITYIAYATGFADYGHFSRVFRKHKGVSASQYRKSTKLK